MKRLIDGARNFFGVETPAEREVWDARVDLLRTTVGVNYFDETFQQQLTREIELLRDADTSDRPQSHNALAICAEERLRVRALCAARCALPAAGVEVSQLQEMGFDTGRPGKERHYGALRVVGFPDGWQMEPVSREPEMISTSFAVIADETGTPQLDVFYRNSVAGEDSPKGFTHLAYPPQAG